MPGHLPPRLPEIRRITTAETLSLRLQVLRPGRPVESARFAGDDASGTVHFGVFVDGALRGIASLYEAELPQQAGQRALQLRGMAVEPQLRGSGLGRALVLACIEFAREQGVAVLWCNARTAASGFYRRLGFEILGDEFDIPDVGPHFRMRFLLK